MSYPMLITVAPAPGVVCQVKHTPSGVGDGVAPAPGGNSQDQPHPLLAGQPQHLLRTGPRCSRANHSNGSAPLRVEPGPRLAHLRSSHTRLPYPALPRSAVPFPPPRAGFSGGRLSRS